MTASHNDSVNKKSEDNVGSLMKRILVRSLILLTAAALIGGVVGWFMAGGHGVASAAVAFAILFIFCLMTPAVFAALSRGSVSFTTLVTCLVVSWIAKVIVVIAALLALRSALWFDHWLFAIYVVVGVVVVLSVEVQAVLTSRLPYVHPQK